MTTKVFIQKDDWVFEGDISGKFQQYDEQTVILSDGTVLSSLFSGMTSLGKFIDWEIKVMNGGALFAEHSPSQPTVGSEFSDKVTLSDGIKWAVITNRDDIQEPIVIIGSTENPEDKKKEWANADLAYKIIEGIQGS